MRTQEYGNRKYTTIDNVKVNELNFPIEINRPAYLSISQLERLCTIVYQDVLIQNASMKNLGAILDYLKKSGFGERPGEEYPCEMTRDEWMRVIDDILSDNVLCSLRIVKHIDVTENNVLLHKNSLPGHRAICFMDNTGEAYIIFRGTSGDYEWLDNAEGIVLADTVQQLASRQFVIDVKEDKNLNVKHITVAGHSKGGNKAQYAAVTAPAGYVNHCVSIDGQGFSEQFLRNYKNELLSKKCFISLMAERRDYVNCIGLRIQNVAFYVGKRGEPGDRHIYGDPIMYFHCPDALRATDGKLGYESPEGDISKVINEFTTYFLTNPKYKTVKYDISVDIISLMMKSKKSPPDATADALKNLTEVFLELVSERISFRNNIVNLLYSEPDLLLATIIQAESVKATSVGFSGENVKSLYFEKLKQEIIKDESFRKNFVSSFLYTTNLLCKMLEDKDPKINELLKYIRKFIDEMLEAFLKKTTEKIVTDIFAAIKDCWNKFTELQRG